MADSFLICKNIYKKYDSVTVDISFEAEEGTLTTIVGPSGSGKSTVLRIIAGLLENDCVKEKNPQIILDGKDITFKKPSKRNIGMIFQSPSLFQHMNVEQNISYGLECNGKRKKDALKEANEFLSRINMEGFAKRMPFTLSGGEAQRVALARTLIVKPKLVLFDESLSALDAPLRKKLGEDIRIMQKEAGFTGIMVTHDINEAKAISDRIILMKNGTKHWEGNPAEFSEELF